MLQGINVLLQMKVKNEVPFILCLVIKLYFGKCDTTLELNNLEYTTNLKPVWTISVGSQGTHRIRMLKLGAHTKVRDNFPGTQQASWQRPSTLHRTEGSSGTYLQVINLQVQHLEHKRREWQKIKGHKNTAPNTKTMPSGDFLN